MAGSLFSPPRARELTPAGAPLAGAKLYFYVTGTTTAATVYQNSTLSLAHTNPVLADVGGLFPAIWLDPAVTYKAVLKTSLDATVWEIDPYAAVGPDAQSIGRLVYPRTAAEISEGVTPVDYTHPEGHVLRYGVNAVPGSTDLTTACQSAINVVRTAGGGVVMFPGAPIRTTAPLLIHGGVILRGEGMGSTILAYYGSSQAIASSTPSTRIYACGVEAMTIYDYGTGTRGLDLSSISSGIFRDLEIYGFTTGVRVWSPTSGFSVYNRFYNVTANQCATGFHLGGASSNAHVFDACRMNGATKTGTIGWLIEDSNGNAVINCQTDVAGTHVKLTASAPGATDGNVCWANRIEDVTTGHDVGANARYTHIGGNYYVLTTTTISDAGAGTVINDPPYAAPGIAANFVSTSSANGHIRYVREVDGGSSLPLMVLRDANTGAGTPITLQLETERSTGSFVRGRRGGATYFEARADGAVAIRDGITAPSAVANMAILYVDAADGDLKVVFADGTVKTIVTDT